MKSMLKMTSVFLVLVSSAAFAAAPATSTSTAKVPGAVHGTTVTPAHPDMATHAPVKGAHKQVAAHERKAIAACKKLHGAARSTCKMNAEAKEKNAMAHVTASK